LVKISLPLTPSELSEIAEFVRVEAMESYQNFSMHSGNMNLSHER